MQEMQCEGDKMKREQIIMTMCDDTGMSCTGI